MITNDDYVQFKELNNRGILHFYTTVKNDFGLNKFNRQESVDKVLNFCKGNNFDVNKVFYTYQTHTSNVLIVTEHNINEEIVDVDGLVTKLTDVALVSYSADCQTILLFDPVEKIIGNVHSGWKGTLNSIIKETVNKFMELGSNPSDIEVYICPSIQKCCFEVEDDVVDQFKEKFDDIDDCITLGEIVDGKQKYFMDTVKINEKVLNKIGVNKVYNSNLCTKCNLLFHSYRREGNKERNMGVIMLKNE